jgi:hypothetical protein
VFDDFFFQVPKDWEVGLGTGDGFFPFLPKILDWDALLGTLGDALRDTIIPIPKLFVQKSDLVVSVCVYSGFFNTMKHSSPTCSRKTDFKYDQIVSGGIPPVTARNRQSNTNQANFKLGFMLQFQSPK